jgi:2-methylcitrate dehydratase PrpD
MSSDLHSFVTRTTLDMLPPAVVTMAKRCLLDLIGTGAAGCQTALSRIVSGHAVRFFGSGERTARILHDGRRASPLGAAMAGGMTIDSFDAHDGHVLTKGHAGCAVFPALAALADASESAMTGAEFLTSLVVGYEVAIRAGISQHRICCDYHTSGAWNALGVVAIAARSLGFDSPTLREALGIAEYHGPRSQMMRCIDYPTMVKDGSGWGAMTGLSAAYLAQDGFTGAPALVVEDLTCGDLWNDLGQRWRILELYFKAYPVCRWAQPAIEAVLSVRRAHSILPDAVRQIEIETFHNAVRLHERAPTSTEAAQYSLPFPVAVAMAYGEMPSAAIMGERLGDPLVRSLAGRIKLVEAPDIEARFPAERFAKAKLKLRDGREFASALTPARGDASSPLSDAEIDEKFSLNAHGVYDAAWADDVRAVVANLASQPSVRPLLDLITQSGQRLPLPG